MVDMNLMARLRDRLDNSLWVIPSAMVVAAIGLALGATLLDDILETRPFSQYVFTGGPDSARAILQTVAAAVITFTGLVFTITIVALQLASQQFSPRVLRTFLRDRQGKYALGTFVATFIYCLVVLRVVSDTDDRGVTIPSISMMVLLVLVLASVGMFVSYISHMANAIRVSSIVAAVGDETRALIDRLPEERADDDRRVRSVIEKTAAHVISAPEPGSLTAINSRGLVELAAERDVAFVMTRGVGDFLAEGQTLFEVRGGEVEPKEAWKNVQLGLERTMQQDVGFGLRQLVDIAEKALSPSMNDPTTAVMALDQIHDVLRRLAAKPFPPTEHTDRDGVVRLVTCPLDWEALVTLAFSEIRHFVRSSAQVIRRMFAALDDLEKVAIPERKDALRAERRMLESLVPRSFDEVHDRDVAQQPDQQGIGSIRSH